jgi:DNA-binding NarL/FixJ family response regulator
MRRQGSAGLSVRGIAGQLVANVQTVGRHVRDYMYGTIGVHERSNARQYAREHGLIAPQLADRHRSDITLPTTFRI